MRINILISLFLVAMISCDKKGDNLIPDIDSYPMTVGTEWTYDRQMILKKYESETSNKIIGIDTMIFTVNVWIEKDTVLNETLSVKAFKSQENDYNNLISTQYMSIDNQGLKTSAYINGGLNVYPKKNGYTKISFNLNLGLNNGSSKNDDIIFEEIPTLDIKLPLDNNSSWTFRQSSETRSLRIDKKVIGTETLHLFGQNFACYKVRWDYLNDNLYNGPEIIDWISEKGLIKRLTFYDRITFTDDMGEPLYSGQYIETLTLKGINLE